MGRISRWAFGLAILWILTGCSAGASEDEAADAESTTSSTLSIELTAQGLEAVGTCTGTIEGDGSIPCIGLVWGEPAAGRAGLNESSRGAVVDWADGNDSVLAELMADDDRRSYRENVDALVERDYEVVVVLGAEAGPVLSEAADSYPDVYFVGVDLFDPQEHSNLAVVAFSEQETGFLAGALAGLLTDSGEVAQILGSALVPPVSNLRSGFIDGVAFTNSRADANSFFHPGDPNVAFEDPGWGASRAAAALEDGADVIFATGGSTGHGALVETAVRGGDARCIGVDSDKWAEVEEAQPCLVTSIVKLVQPAIGEVLDAVAEGEPLDGEVLGAVGYSPYHDFAEIIPGEIQDAAENIAAQVDSGELKVGDR